MGRMVRTWNSSIAAEMCPVCTSVDVRAREPDWFAIELDRGPELRGQDAFEVEFACRECGSVWR